MNYRFKRKYLEVQAFQMTEERRLDNSEWPDWLDRAWNKDPLDLGALFCHGPKLYITTLGGRKTFHPKNNCWIVMEAEDKLYILKPGNFEAIFEEMPRETESPFDIVVVQSKSSKLWYWRIFVPGQEQQPVVASNGYAEITDCEYNLNLIRKVFAAERFPDDKKEQTDEDADNKTDS